MCLKNNGDWINVWLLFTIRFCYLKFHYYYFIITNRQVWRVSLLSSTVHIDIFFYITAHIKRILTIQIKLLNCGQTILAMEVEGKMMELIAQYNSYENIPEDSIAPILVYEVLADEMSSKFSHFYLNLIIYYEQVSVNITLIIVT